jgi:hypothetical protein
MAGVPTPKATRIGETSITLSWDASSPAPAAQALQVRIVPNPWQAGRTVALQPGALSAEVGGLNPTASFEFRLAFTLPDGSTVLGKSTACDTLPAGCGDSGSKQQKCSLQ